MSFNSKLIHLCSSLLLFSQTERHSPLLGLRSRPSLDGGKMRASVRMTRYLESWGAAKPFANLHHRDSMTTDNGKINTTVSTMQCSQSFKHTHTTQMQILVDEWSDSSLRMFQWGSTTYREEKGELGATVFKILMHEITLWLICPPLPPIPGPNLKGGGLRRNSMSG